MKLWKRKGMLHRAALIKKRKVKLEPSVSPAEACSRGERHLQRHEYKRAFACFNRAARECNSRAWAKLGVMYYWGLGCTADHETARICIKCARIAKKIADSEVCN